MLLLLTLLITDHYLTVLQSKNPICGIPGINRSDHGIGTAGGEPEQFSLGNNVEYACNSSGSCPEAYERLAGIVDTGLEDIALHNE